MLEKINSIKTLNNLMYNQTFKADPRIHLVKLSLKNKEVIKVKPNQIPFDLLFLLKNKSTYNCLSNATPNLYFLETESKYLYYFSLMLTNSLFYQNFSILDLYLYKKKKSFYLNYN